MDLLKKIRKDNQLTQIEMAKRLKVSESMYTKIETGHMKPSFNFIYKVKTEFPEIDTNDFFK